MAKTPAQIAEKWSRNLSNSSTDIIAGINAVTENPMQKAVAKQAKLKQNWNAAIDSGKWATNTGAVTLAQWKKAFLDKGVSRITSGATASVSKVQAFHESLAAYQAAGLAQLESMPDLTVEDGINRQAFWTRYMANFPG